MLRTQGVCSLCDSPLNGYYEADHIVPLWQGGSNEPENFRALCKPCHLEVTVENTSFRAEVKAIRGETGQRARRDKNGSQFKKSRAFPEKSGNGFGSSGGFNSRGF